MLFNLFGCILRIEHVKDSSGVSCITIKNSSGVSCISVLARILLPAKTKSDESCQFPFVCGTGTFDVVMTCN